MAQLLDLDGLLEKVIAPETRVYFAESISAYRAGALRSAVGTLWVAVCVDLIEKTRELAMMGEPEAIALSQKFQNLVENSNIDGLLKFERELLEMACRKLELISPAEIRYFERIKEDRNQAMHPSFRPEGTQVSFAPELVRSHLVHAATLLFNVPSTKGKSIIDRIFALVTEESFPTTVEEAHTVLSSRSHLERVKESTIRNIIITFFKRLFVDVEPINITVVERYAAALGAIERIHGPVAVSVVSGNLSKLLASQNDKMIRRLVGLLAFIPTYWDRLESSIKVRVKGAIRGLSIDDFRKYRAIHASSNIRDLHVVTKDRIKLFDLDDRRKALSILPQKYLISEVVELYTSAGSFDFANSVGKSVVVQYADMFSAEDILAVLGKVFSNQKSRINQVLSSSGADEVFAELARQPLTEDESVRASWFEFHRKLSEIGYDFEILEQELVKSRVIPIKSDRSQPPRSEEIPF
jgi:hypothetical protein